MEILTGKTYHTPTSVSFHNENLEIQLVNADTFVIDLKTLYETTLVVPNDLSIQIVFPMYGYTVWIECMNDGTLHHYVHDQEGKHYQILNESIITTLTIGLMVMYHLHNNLHIRVEVN